MSIPSVPAQSDIRISFEDIKYSSDESDSTINLNALDNIIFSISFKKPNSTPIYTTDYVANPSDFTIDDTNKIVEVFISSTHIGTTLGKYCVNLWLVKNGVHITHLTKFFNLVASVSYS